ncbi:hypothetical protein Amn_50050 [Aminobacter sp. Y103A]|nr:hypothetical protein Amn_50050 [Aminobacter sp. SS-2016]
MKAMDVGGAANPYSLEASSDFNAYVIDVQHALRTGASRPGTITARGWRPAQACSSRLSRLVR